MDFQMQVHTFFPNLTGIPFVLREGDQELWFSADVWKESAYRVEIYPPWTRLERPDVEFHACFHIWNKQFYSKQLHTRNTRVLIWAVSAPVACFPTKKGRLCFRHCRNVNTFCWTVVGGQPYCSTFLIALETVNVHIQSAFYASAKFNNATFSWFWSSISAVL